MAGRNTGALVQERVRAMTRHERGQKKKSATAVDGSGTGHTAVLWLKLINYGLGRRSKHDHDRKKSNEKLRQHKRAVWGRAVLALVHPTASCHADTHGPAAHGGWWDSRKIYLFRERLGASGLTATVMSLTDFQRHTKVI